MWLLLPFSWLFGILVTLRKHLWSVQAKHRRVYSVPVCVIGNITVGGTGKSPLVMWLVQWLQNRGVRVGVVSRGYGGRSTQYPLEVSTNTLPSVAGEEPVMIARRTGVPVIVDPRRSRAVREINHRHKLDIVLSDDGLQHYAMARDIEIAVLDGTQGVGNGRLLPAGPLRERLARLQSVDWVVSNSEKTEVANNASIMNVVPTCFKKIDDDQVLSIQEFFSTFGSRITVITAIGNPSRLRQTLSLLGFQFKLIAYPDHHPFTEQELAAVDAEVLVTTEKDAQKIRVIPSIARRCWYLEVDLQFAPEVDDFLTNLFRDNHVQIEN